MRRGVVYALSHPDWLNETLRSAQSCMRLMPDVERELYLPWNSNLKDPHGLFTRIVKLERFRHPSRPRFDAALQTQLDQAIFIDGDTLFVMPVPEIFETLDAVDIAAAYDNQYFHSRGIKTGIYDKIPKVPITVREWNGGVIAMQMNDATRAFVTEWSDLFAECRKLGYSMDQAALRSVLFHTRLRLATLDSLWNFRAEKPQYVFGAVRILHAHGDLPAIARTINLKRGYRLYQPDPALIFGHQPKEFLEKLPSGPSH
jgi:hypothetical protein